MTERTASLLLCAFVLAAPIAALYAFHRFPLLDRLLDAVEGWLWRRWADHVMRRGLRRLRREGRL